MLFGICTKGKMMNITFFIGNGFDIGMGMKSRFKDFFPIYQEKSMYKEARIKQLSDEIGDDYDTWADFEAALGEYTINFDHETKKDFIDQIRDFESEFMDYLKVNEDAAQLNNNEQLEALMKNALVQFYSTNNLAFESSEAVAKVYYVHNSENHKYNFVNFNYTATLKKCLGSISQSIVQKRKIGNVEKIDKVGEVLHVHGECGLYPIIGVNDINQIANKELAEDENFTRYIVKPSINKFLRRAKDVDATRIINQSTIVCIYGMSLGTTDKKWWNLLITWLFGSGERQLVIFDYDDQFKTSTQFDWLEKEDSIISKLEKYNVEPKIKLASLRSRIHIAVHKNIFSIDNVKEN